MCVCLCISLNTCWLRTVLGRKHLAMGGSGTLSVYCITTTRLYTPKFTQDLKVRCVHKAKWTKQSTNETLQGSPGLPKVQHILITFGPYEEPGHCNHTQRCTKDYQVTVTWLFSDGVWFQDAAKWEMCMQRPHYRKRPVGASVIGSSRIQTRIPMRAICLSDTD